MSPAVLNEDIVVGSCEFEDVWGKFVTEMVVP